MVGIRDLARHLDISIGTVSRALNDKVDVNRETRDRVREAAATLGYSPNQSGRSLRRGRTDLVGVIVPANSESELIDTVFLSVLDGLRRRLSESRLDLAIFVQDQEADVFGSLRRLAERGLVDGMIITNTRRIDPRIDYLLERGQPFVAFGRSASGEGYPWVDPDFDAAVDGAIDHLAQRGHTRIGLILPSRDINYLNLIVEAYGHALRSRGLPADPAYIQRSRGGERGGYDAGAALLAMQAPPTAILVSGAVETFGLYRRIGAMGRKPGRDLSVLGLLPEHRVQMLSPALTSFTTDWTAIGSKLGQALIDAMPGLASGRGPSKPSSAGVLAKVTFANGASVHEL